jgi:hypothetical protein
VIGEPGDDDAGAAGVDLSDAQGEIVRLAPGTGEHHLGEFRREVPEEPFGIVEDRVVQVARMGVEQAGLPRQGRHHVRMAVAHRRDVVVHVEIGALLRIVEPHALPSHQMDRIGIEEPIGGSEQALPAGDHVLLARREAHVVGGVVGVDHRHARHAPWQARCR